MNKKDAISWLQSLKENISQAQFSALWHYAGVLDEIISILQVDGETEVKDDL